MKISKFITVASILTIGLAIGAAILNYQTSNQAGQKSRELFSELETNAEDFHSLVSAVHQLEIDVLQTQQWITDISATRGMNGLDDGFEIAAGFAERFPGDVNTARELATKLDMPELMSILDTLLETYPTYYEVGLEMGNAYVSGGAALGNLSMAKFDGVAELMGGAVDSMLQISEEAFVADMRGSADALHVLENSNSQQALIVLTSSLFVALMVLLQAFFVIAIILKKLNQANKELISLVDGDVDIVLTKETFWDEFKLLSEAISQFKDSTHKVSALGKAEKSANLKRNEDRAGMMRQLGEAFGDVVGAAVKGDFSKRVEAEFPDEELNKLGVQVNELVGTVERGLAETGEVLGALAATDLTKRVSGEYQGAFLELKKDTNAVADNLSKIVRKLRETSGALKTATGEILEGANDLSERTTKQAANVEETSATMEELSGLVVENALKAEQVGKNAGAVAHAAVEGGQVMVETTQAMERITTSSSKISNIIGMIDDIAFQTNLLALNASVEAARAGEAGKGFAVVAVEVRRLAQSAATASSEVKVLIDQSAVEVDQGSKLVALASAKLEEMMGGAEKNKTIMAEVVAANKTQASSIEEVNAAVRQMDEMTQHNAALVEETNAAIEQTDNQVGELDRIIDVFKVSGDTKLSGNVNAPASFSASTPSAMSMPPVKQLQAKVQSAAQSYLSEGSAAVDSEWDEF